MSPGSSTESYPAFARIGLRENHGKNLNQVTCPDRDSNPGHLVSQPDALTVTPQTFEMGRACSMGESRNAYRVLVGRPEGERPLGRPRRRWEDNIKMDLREVGYDRREWINLAQDRDQWWAYVRVAMYLRVERLLWGILSNPTHKSSCRRFTPADKHLLDTADRN
ncbi:hypothetical protein ANN_02594 [Periplaneta americana]|uniref:Uncharacterized protein n=1 Tax=Periplaneta americana TaxID=6978 RepID=A0ABQ8TWQ8_PERAM|nr:hypothetical protein ANN_02594 [Periplaneta americana]